MQEIVDTLLCVIEATVPNAYTHAHTQHEKQYYCNSTSPKITLETNSPHFKKF